MMAIYGDDVQNNYEQNVSLKTAILLNIDITLC